MKRLAFALILAGSLASVACAQTASELSKAAKAAVEKGEYLRAAELYVSASQKDPSRTTDLYNGACAYALAGRKEEAIRCLLDVADRGFEMRDLIKTDTDLDSLRSDPGWKRVVSKVETNYWKNHDAIGSMRFWDGPAWRSPYREPLSVDERVSGLSKLWAEIKYNSSALDLRHNVDWDGIYAKSLASARTAPSAFEYLSILRRCVAAVGDATSRVNAPAELERKIGYAPVSVRGVDRRLFVVGASSKAKSAGAINGCEIVAVDGIPTGQYIDKYVAPLMNATNPQNLAALAFGNAFSEGPIERPIVLTLTNGGKTVQARLNRLGHDDWAKAVNYRPYEFRMLPGNVAYIAFRSFNDVAARTALVKDWPKFEKADAMIFDLRENSEGDVQVALPVVSMLMRAPIYFYQWGRLEYTPDDRFSASRRSVVGPTITTSMWSNVPNHFDKPLALLVGPGTGQSAELFALACASAKRGPLVGESTAGSGGLAPFSVSLPGGFSLNIATDRLRAPNGEFFTLVGISPTVSARQSAKNFLAGRDPVVERALESLRAGAGS